MPWLVTANATSAMTNLRVANPACLAYETHFPALPLERLIDTFRRLDSSTRPESGSVPLTLSSVGLSAGAYGLRNVKQAVSGIGTCANYRTAPNRPTVTGRYRTCAFFSSARFPTLPPCCRDIRLGIELPRDRRAVIGRTSQRPAMNQGRSELCQQSPRRCPHSRSVPSVQFVAVVQPHRPFKGRPGSGAHSRIFLAQVHAHVIVHPAGSDHLPLRRIPQLVAGLAVLKLLSGS